MGITWEEAEVAAHHNRSEWRRSVAQCIYGLNQVQGKGEKFAKFNELFNGYKRTVQWLKL